MRSQIVENLELPSYDTFVKEQNDLITNDTLESEIFISPAGRKHLHYFAFEDGESCTHPENYDPALDEDNAELRVWDLCWIGEILNVSKLITWHICR